MSEIFKGTLLSFFSGFFTIFGAIPVFFVNRKISHKTYSSMLGISGGIMLAATFFSLIIPALEISNVWIVALGLISGVFFIEIISRIIPHEHFFKGREGPQLNIKRIFLFMFAITIHNLPEGMSVGTSWAIDDKTKSIALALGIGIQNVPEGTAIALPMLSLGYSPLYCFFITFLSGMVEPVGGFIGISIVNSFNNILPLFLSFSAGCMLYVISGEMIPESHDKGYGKLATWWLVCGFVLMMILDNILK
ncbi:MAG: ZIP family metal transporter [Elusimicrobiales bacterium]|nr:ZIP family metal transporter [Elusimicrobiales bacterium]